MTDKNKKIIKSIAILLAFCFTVVTFYPILAFAQGEEGVIGSSYDGEQQVEAVEESTLDNQGELSVDSNHFGAAASEEVGLSLEYGKYFDSFTKNDMPPTDIQIKVRIAGNSSVAGGSVVVNAGIENGYLGTSKPYFVLDHISNSSGELVEDTADLGGGNIIINLKDDIQSAGIEEVTLTFVFDAENYAGKVKPDALMMKPKAELLVSGVSVLNKNSEGVFSTAKNIRSAEFTSANPKNNESGKLTYSGGEKINFSIVVNNDDYYQALLDESYNHTYKLYLPIGTVIDDNSDYTVDTGATLEAGITLTEGEVDSVPAGNYYILTYTLPNDSTDPTAGWSNPNGDGNTFYARINSGLTLPVASDGTNFEIYSVFDYKLKSDVEPISETDLIEYQQNDVIISDFRFVGHHSTQNGEQATSGIKDGDKSDLAVYTGFDYYDALTTGNNGNIPVNGVEFTLYQDTTEGNPEKINFDTVELLIGRAHKGISFSQYNVTYEIINAKNSDLSRVEGPFGYSVNASNKIDENIKLEINGDITLSANEYINKIIAVPTGVDGTEVGVMPMQNSFAFKYTFKAWSNQHWPNETEINSNTVVRVGWSIEYRSNTNILHNVVGDFYEVEYKATAPFAVVNTVPFGNNISNLKPKSKVDIRVNAYNNSLYGASEAWSAPVVVLGASAGIKLNSFDDITLVDGNGTSIGEVRVELIPQTENAKLNNRTYYRFSLPDNYNLVVSDNLVGFTFDISLLLPTGITQGIYNLDVILTSKDGTAFNMADSTYLNNQLPYGVELEDIGFSNEDKYTYSNSIFPQGTFEVKQDHSLNLHSRIKTDTIAPNWSSDEVVPSQSGDNATVEFNIENQGNTVLGDLFAYTVLPRHNLETLDGKTTIGNVVLKEVKAEGGEIYYFIGNGTPPTANSIGSVNLNAFGWTTTQPNLGMVKAIYVDFSSTALNPEEQYKLVLDYKLLNTNPENAVIYNQFAAKYAFDGSTVVTVSDSQAFANNGYNLKYVAPQGANNIVNMPENISGLFAVESWVDLTISNKIPVRPAYRFIGWRDINTNTMYYANNTIRLYADGIKNIELEAIFVLDQEYAVTLIFHTNGATGGTINPHTILSTAGTVVAPPDISSLVKSGYRPTGRFFTTPNPTETEMSWNFTAPLPQQETINLYVEWEAVPPTGNYYTVSFDVNGGNPAYKPANITAEEGNMVGALPQGLIREGFIFKGWSTNVGESNTANFTSSNIINSNTVVYAVWEKQLLTVSFNLNGGGGTAPASANVEYGQTLDNLPMELIRAGYIHRGWSINPNSLVADFKADTQIKSNINLYAVWEKSTPSITIVTLKYNYNQTWEQAVETDRKIIEVDAGTSYTIAPADIDKYVFMGDKSDALSYSDINGEIVVNLRYQHEIYSLKGITTLDIEAVRLGANGSKTISVQKLAKLAEIKMTSNKNSKTVSLPRDAVLESEDLEDLDLTKLTAGYDKDVVINCKWANGQESNIVIMIKVGDTTSPEISVNSQQRLAFSVREGLPKTEAELYSMLLKKGLVIKDNYDFYPKIEITYLDGGFNSILWQEKEDYIIFINAIDSSGNKLEFAKAVIISVES